VVLARKARSLRPGTVLSGWLYQTARLTAANALRRQIRRQHREQEAYMQSTLNEPEPDPWGQIAPMLEQAMAGLNEADRNAIILRYFENKQLKDVGAALGTSDDAAKMRVNRALEKLRGFFLKRGVTLSGAALGAAITAHSVEAAPIGLSAAVIAACQGSALTASTVTLAKGTLKFMAWTKLNVAVGVAAAAVVAVQWSQISSQKKDNAVLQTQFEQASRQNEAQQEEIAKLQKESDTMAQGVRNMVRESSQAAARRGPAPAPAPAGDPAAGARGKGMGSMIENMMKDPDMMKVMQEAQVTAVKQMYAPLAKQLNLTPEQRDAFYGLLVENATNVQALGFQMLSGTNNAEAVKDMAASQKAVNDQIQSLLGGSGYAQYQDFQASLGDRNTLQQLQTSGDYADNPLSDEQQQRLLQLMKTERETVHAPSPAESTSAYVSSQPQERVAMMDQVLQQQETINANVLQQAGTFLSPQQVQMLGTTQSNMVSMQKMGSAMAQKFMGTPSN
jgi:RNA polymerase sigma factor (sigma-70 family)